jgi:phthalate 3,4-dioxygenase ferredoxin reductase component
LPCQPVSIKPQTTLVVGASIAGIRCAQALRDGGHAGRLVVIGGEAEEPYDRPPLSKQVLSGAWVPERTRLARFEGAFTGIELLLGVRAESLDISASSITIATGACPVPSPWDDAEGVHVLRSLTDSLGLRADLRRGGPLVVIGGGFIGSEVASTARALGLDVTVIDTEPVPAARIVGPTIGAAITSLHERHGVHVMFGTRVERILADYHTGRVRGVRTSAGQTVPADVVVVAIGAKPATRWLKGSGLDITDGVLCDEYGQAAGAANVFAAGDVARWADPGRVGATRFEHWTNAVEQAASLAGNLIRPDARVAHIPSHYFWSDQFDWRIQMVGRRIGDDALWTAGDLTAGQFAALYGDDAGGLTAAVTVNWPRALNLARNLIAGSAAVSDARAALSGW